jgi:hypothetical protein
LRLRIDHSTRSFVIAIVSIAPLQQERRPIPAAS